MSPILYKAGDRVKIVRADPYSYEDEVTVGRVYTVTRVADPVKDAGLVSNGLVIQVRGDKWPWAWLRQFEFVLVE